MVAATMLQCSPPDERRANWRLHGEMLQRNAVQMERLIRDLLDFSRLESGMLAVSPAPEPFDEILDHAVESARAAAPGGVQIERVGPHSGLVVPCDRERVLQVLGNLLANSVRHTPHGGRITVQATAASDAVHVSVHDTGAGIEPEKLARLFDRHWQTSPDDGSRHSGLGLGLSIAKGLVQAHGGRIWADSRPGIGSTFHFTLPLHGTRILPQADGGTILLVDDDADFAREAAEILLEQGYRAVALGDGRQALEYLERNPPPALILLDLMMPDVGGWEVFASLRSHPILTTVPVVVTTCLGDEGIEPVLADAAGYLQKPVPMARLLETAERFCGAPSAEARFAQGN